MSEISPRQRRRRADATRSEAAILEAARILLARDSTANVEQVAKAAHVSRQTVYAHFGTREGLIDAVTDAVADEAAAKIEAARLDEGPPASALLRLLEASWTTVHRYPHLLTAAGRPASRPDDDRHLAVARQLDRIIARGQRSGDFAASLPVSWLRTAIITLGHAAADAATHGNMTRDEAARVLSESALQLCGAVAT